MKTFYIYIRCFLLFPFLLPLLGVEHIGWAGNIPVDFPQAQPGKSYGELSKLGRIEVNLRAKGYILESFLPKLSHYYHKVVVLNEPAGHEVKSIYRLDKSKLVLFLCEPRVTMPHTYDKKFHSHFSKIFTWDDDLVDNQTYFKFFYSDMRPMIENLPSFQEKKFCCLFGTNLYSGVAGELYSERKKTVEFFETKTASLFDLYGRGWDSCGYRNYRGYVSDKIGTLKNYKFNICYENSSREKGYITEKILDSFCAGVVPIYWGAPNVEDYIPKGCFIDRRDFPDNESLFAFLERVTEEQYELYLDNIRTFLASEKAQLFSPENFVRLFSEEVP